MIVICAKVNAWNKVLFQLNCNKLVDFSVVFAKTNKRDTSLQKKYTD